MTPDPPNPLTDGPPPEGADIPEMPAEVPEEPVSAAPVEASHPKKKGLSKAEGREKVKRFIAEHWPTKNGEKEKGNLSELINFPPADANASASDVSTSTDTDPRPVDTDHSLSMLPPSAELDDRTAVTHKIIMVAAWTFALCALGLSLRQGNLSSLMGLVAVILFFLGVHVTNKIGWPLYQSTLSSRTQFLLGLFGAAIVLATSCMYVRPSGGKSVWIVDGETTFDQAVIWGSPLARADRLMIHQTVEGKFRASSRDGYSVTGTFLIECELLTDETKVQRYVTRTSDTHVTLHKTIQAFARAHVQNDLEQSNLKQWVGVTGLQLPLEGEEVVNLLEKVPIAWNGYIAIKQPVAELVYAP